MLPQRIVSKCNSSMVLPVSGNQPCPAQSFRLEVFRLGLFDRQNLIPYLQICRQWCQRTFALDSCPWACFSCPPSRGPGRVGLNAYGQLGDGSTISRPLLRPAAAPAPWGAAAVAAVAAGDWHTVALAGVARRAVAWPGSLSPLLGFGLMRSRILIKGQHCPGGGRLERS